MSRWKKIPTKYKEDMPSWVYIKIDGKEISAGPIETCWLDDEERYSFFWGESDVTESYSGQITHYMNVNG